MSKKQIAISFDARMILHSGIGTYIVNILQRLEESNRICLRLFGEEKKILVRLPNWNGKITPFSAPIYSLAEQLHYPPLKAKEILHVPHYNAPLRYLRRSIVTIHDLIHLQSKQFALPHYRLYSYGLLTAVTRLVPQILTVSEESRNGILKTFPKAQGKTTLIRNGFQPFPKNSPKEQKKFIERFRLPKEYLLHVGLGKKHKNVDFLIRALAKEWKEGRLTMPLILAGCGTEIPPYVQKQVNRFEVSAFVRALGRLSFRDLSCLYECAKVLLFPSLYEGFGLPVLEALGCQTPVLCSNIPVLKEVGGDAALFFDPNDEEEFRRKLYRLLHDPIFYRKQQSYGKKHVAYFSWDRHAEELLQVYSRAHDFLF